MESDNQLWTEEFPQEYIKDIVDKANEERAMHRGLEPLTFYVNPEHYRRIMQSASVGAGNYYGTFERLEIIDRIKEDK